MSQSQEFSEGFKKGLKVRGEVLGEEYVSKAVASLDNEYWKPAQELITEYAWGNSSHIGVFDGSKGMAGIDVTYQGSYAKWLDGD
ncbi:hypothetical protein Focb16_v015687 [Fusarium oxysporum f. sp. cubense]|uniref:Uncharacterized protein n=1 Tax=Fusarium oxysporum f. sp. cubense TaxID=61366 RepID=A0A559KZ45_FUSOC|nr:hypothetical protein Focb16_v015687 [Fusarium oxysporum f. sp. cubense]